MRKTEQDWIEVFSAAQYPSFSTEDVSTLAREYSQSGLELGFDGLQTCDVASTGGPSSLSTLITPLAMLQNEDVVVPKLGVPGRPAGGLDVLSQIAGYRVALDKNEIRETITRCRYAHFESNGQFAPLDSYTFTLRQKVGMQSVPNLVVASLLSKKLAVGVLNTGLDVRISSVGNFGGSLSVAAENAKLFINVARRLGINARCFLTDGSVPNQPFIGRGEALLALSKLFSGSADAWLQRHYEECKAMSHALFNVGAQSSFSPLEQFFADNVVAQGGSIDAFWEYAAAVQRGHKIELYAPDNGYVRYDLGAIRSLIVGTNAHSHEWKKFPDRCGLWLRGEPGQYLQKGDILLTARSSPEFTGDIHAALSDCFRIDEEPTMPAPMEAVGD